MISKRLKEHSRQVPFASSSFFIVRHLSTNDKWIKMNKLSLKNLSGENKKVNEPKLLFRVTLATFTTKEEVHRLRFFFLKKGKKKLILQDVSTARRFWSSSKKAFKIIIINLNYNRLVRWLVRLFFFLFQRRTSLTSELTQLLCPSVAMEISRSWPPIKVN